MTNEQMKDKLLEWNPSWNVGRFTDRQIAVIYNKERDKRERKKNQERNKMVQAIVESYT